MRVRRHGHRDSLPGSCADRRPQYLPQHVPGARVITSGSWGVKLLDNRKMRDLAKTLPRHVGHRKFRV